MIQNKDFSSLVEISPIQFLDVMEEEKHIIMFDENPQYSKKIQFHFLKTGLEKWEHGIDVEKYKDETWGIRDFVVNKGRVCGAGGVFLCIFPLHLNLQIES